jgi:SAM-dependent methyltransferase
MALDFKINKLFFDNYPENISIREDRVKIWWKEAINYTFKDITLNQKVILEVGAGKGILASFYPFEPAMLIYTDISFKRFKMNRYKKLFSDNSFGISNDINFPCFKEDTFDIIVIMNCIPFVENKVECVEYYKTLLRKDGCIVIIELMQDNPFYKIRKKISSEYKKISIKSITYKEVEKICRNSITIKKKYFYFLSILTASLLLKFPENVIVKKIHRFGEAIDKYLLKVEKMQRWAVLACVVIKK